MPPSVRGLVAVLLGALALSSSAAAGAPDPRPPCGEVAFPGYGAVGAAPSLAVWRAGDLQRTGWRPAACLGWSGPSLSAAALAGEFRFAGTVDDLLARFGALGSYPSIKYWSTSRKGWFALVDSAGVVAGPEGPAVKAAFDAGDFVVGKDNYYSETSSRSGRTVYRLRLLARAPDRAVLASENVTPIRALGFTLFGPSALQYVTFLDKRAGGVWGYYQIVRTGEGASRLAGGNEASYLNRLTALFRYMAGLPTDSEPPAAR